MQGFQTQARVSEVVSVKKVDRKVMGKLRSFSEIERYLWLKKEYSRIKKIIERFGEWRGPKEKRCLVPPPQHPLETALFPVSLALRLAPLLLLLLLLSAVPIYFPRVGFLLIFFGGLLFVKMYDCGFEDGEAWGVAKERGWIVGSRLKDFEEIVRDEFRR